MRRMAILHETVGVQFLFILSPRVQRAVMKRDAKIGAKLSS